MLRRTILKLSRRNGLGRPGAARLNVAPRRCFHPSFSSLNSSDPPSSNKLEFTTNPSTPSPATPKFGGSRWGARQTATPAALSADEQAIRSALLAKQGEERRRQEQLQQQRQQQIQRQRETRSQNSKRPPFSRLPSAQPVWVPKSATEQTHPSFGSAEGGDRISSMSRGPRSHLRDQKIHDHQPRAHFDVNGPFKVPPQLRQQDWECPDCSNLCFGKHMLCPRCKARRPMLRRVSQHPQPERSTQPRPDTTAQSSQDISKVRSIASRDTPGLDGKLDPKLYPKDAALRHHIAAKQSNTEGQPERRRDRNWKYSGLRETEAEDAPPKEKSPREKQVLDDPWSWDPASLNRLKLQDSSVEPDSKPKRRDGRRERKSNTEEEEYDVEEYRRRRDDRKRQKKERSQKREVVSAPTPLYLPEFISVSNLADVIGMRPAQFVQRLEEMGFEDVSYTHVLDLETSSLITTEFGFEPILNTGADEDLTAAPEPEDKTTLPSRPPVVTIMGHVDHGKTTILDWLRKSSVVASEHGGITQHIGAFSVPMPSGKTITFLDTPGHAAFLEMRRRGADVTDIIVLVVAADDSVKPQTIEAIKHATGAKVPVIVAISKIDKESKNPDKVKQDLAVHGVHVEDYGGDVQAIGVSGKTGHGMLDLEEAILTLSEVLDHRADPHGVVEGWVVEATTKTYGRVATVLVRRGTLRPGDILVAGNTWTRVRTLRNEAGVSISEATPGTPVEVDGWREQPLAGSEFLQAGDEQHAKNVVEYRQARLESEKLGEDTIAINVARRELSEKRRREAAEDADSLTAVEKPSGPKAINFIVKADVGGSAEAVLNSITAVGNNEVYANVLRSEVGPISEFDIEHADAAGGRIISFNMPIDPAMSRMAESRGVRIMDYNIIYKLVDEVKDTLSEQLPPKITQRVTGEAEIGQVFEITLKGRNKTTIAGCKVRNGTINRARKVRVLRGQETLYDGAITSLKNVKKDVMEMRKDTECGIGFENWQDFAPGDQVQCYEEISEKRRL
ncbi:hypothetical protein BJX99DRAFT_119691 [Aspergillus californicus]